MKNKIVVYTALFGNYDDLKDPLYTDSRFDMVYFSEQEIPGLTDWVFRPPIRTFESFSMSNRYHKFFPHVIFKDEYDYSLYIDSNLLISGPGFYEELIACIESNVSFGALALSNCYTSRQELALLYRKSIIPKKMYHETIEFLDQNNPGYLDQKIHNSIIFRDHHLKSLSKFSDDWWQSYVDTCRRDQVLMPVFLKKHHIEIVYILIVNLRIFDFIRILLVFIIKRFLISVGPNQI